MFLLAAVFTVAGSSDTNPWLHDLFTPLDTSLLLTLALFNWLVFKKNFAPSFVPRNISFLGSSLSCSLSSPI